MTQPIWSIKMRSPTLEEAKALLAVAANRPLDSPEYPGLHDLQAAFRVFLESMPQEEEFANVMSGVCATTGQYYVLLEMIYDLIYRIKKLETEVRHSLRF